MSKLEVPDNIIRYSSDSLEEVLRDELLEKFGERFTRYRDRYNRYINISSLDDVGDEKYPISVILELVNRCNLECIMCSQEHRNNSKKVSISESDIEKIFDDFKKNSLDALLLSVSEPLLYNRIPKVLDLAEDAGIMDLFLFTNGELLNEKRSEMILNSNVTRLFISLDAVSEDVYNKVRPRVKKDLNENYQRLCGVEKNIMNFMDMRKSLGRRLPLVRVSFVLLEENKNEADEFVSRWKDVVDSVEIQREVSINAYNEISMSTDYAHMAWEQEVLCREPWGQAAVYANGDVSPCCNLVGRNIKVGNIYKESLSNIWSGGKMKKIRRELSTGCPNNVCSSCILNTASNFPVIRK